MDLAVRAAGHVERAVRRLRRSPGFAVAVVLTLGLAIGANTAVFSVVRGVVKPLPHRGGDRIVYLQQSAELAGIPNAYFSIPEILDMRAASRTLEGFAGFSVASFTLAAGDVVRPVTAGVVTSRFFEVMGLSARIGRVFDPDADGEDADPVAVLTHAHWVESFGGDPGVTGTTVRVGGRPVTIVGVLQPVPDFPARTDLLVNTVTSPHHLSATMVHGRTHRMTEVMARLSEGETLEGARTEIEGLARRLRAEHPDAYDPNAGYRIEVTPLRDVLTARARATFGLLWATAVLLLAVAGASVTNLILARSVRRESDFRIRLALGAGRGRMRGLLLAEHAVLGAAASALGVALAVGGVELLVPFAARLTPRAAEIRVDVPALLFAVALAALLAVVLAWLPSLPGKAPGARSVVSTARVARRGSAQGLQSALVMAQVAVSVVLLNGAALLARTLANLYEVDLGAAVQGVLTVAVPPTDGILDNVGQHDRYDRIRGRIASLPGVRDVTMGSNLPLRSTEFELDVKAEGVARDPDLPALRAEYRTATPDYFRASGIELLAGRPFRTTDGPEAPRVAILNESLAARLFPGRDPVGRRVAWTGEVLRFIPVTGDWRTVVGVVRDTRDSGPAAAPHAALYQPFAQEEVLDGWLLIRASTDPATLVPAVTRAIREVASDQPVGRTATLRDIRSEAVAPQRVNAALAGALAVLALGIAGVGLGGVLAFSVSQRTREIGIRMSLGADRPRVRWLVVSEGLRLLLAGVLAGATASVAASGLLSSLVFRISPNDPPTLAGVALFMIGVGVASAWVPAARASAVDPSTAIRHE